MGYRTYIGKLSKTQHEKIKNLSIDELYTSKGINREYDNLAPWELLDGKDLYGFGKHTEFDDEKFYKPVFDNTETQKYYTEESDFWIVEKEYLEHIINFYQDFVKDYYNRLVMPFFGDDVHKQNSLTFLNSIKTDYSYQNNNHTFDFSLITQKEQNALYEMINHIKSMRLEWFCDSPFNLKDGDSITNSWKYEYGIFELVRIYKTFDWENDLLIYYGF
jgi:hypothetical protein